MCHCLNVECNISGAHALQLAQRGGNLYRCPNIDGKHQHFSFCLLTTQKHNQPNNIAAVYKTQRLHLWMVSIWGTPGRDVRCNKWSWGVRFTIENWLNCLFWNVLSFDTSIMLSRIMLRREVAQAEIWQDFPCYSLLASKLVEAELTAPLLVDTHIFLT